MPKRKISDKDYESLRKKLRKIEDKLRHQKRSEKRVKRRRVRVLSNSSSESLGDSSASTLKTNVNEDGTNLPTATTSGASAPRASPPAEVAVCVDATEAVDVADTDQNETEALETEVLDTEVLEILGIDPTTTKNYGKEIQKDLAVRLEHGATEGLSKDSRKELLDTYLVPSNCQLIGPPVLNPELKAALSEPVIKRDKAIEAKQKVTAAAISSLGQAMSRAISSKEKDTTLLRLLMDTARMLCDCQHSDTLTRRNYVISSIKKDMKESLQGAKADTFLFGKNLNDTLKAAKAINKSGSELKVNPTPKPGSSKKFTPSTSKNWKTTPPVRKSAPAATKETTGSSTTRSQRANSSKPLQSYRPSRGRR